MGKSRARNPTQNPTQNPTSNRPKPSRTIQRLRSAPWPQALRSACDAWRLRGLLSRKRPRTYKSKNKNENEVCCCCEWGGSGKRIRIPSALTTRRSKMLHLMLRVETISPPPTPRGQPAARKIHTASYARPPRAPLAATARYRRWWKPAHTQASLAARWTMVCRLASAARSLS